MKINLIQDSRVINPITGVELKLGDKAIVQGSSYSITFLYEGEYSNDLWQPKGIIKNDFRGKGGTLIGEFWFPTLEYNSSTNKTTIVCNIKASVTKDIPPTVYQGRPNEPLNNRTAYVYEIRLEKRSDSDNILSIVEPSFVQVKPGVF